MILFLPETLASKVAVDGFRQEYRIYIGPAFLLAVSYLIARVYQFFDDVHGERKIKKARIAYLEKLTPEEKGYLWSYIIEGNNSIMCGPDDGIMGGLEAKCIAYRAASVGDMLNGFAYNLQPWAREHLEKNPHLLNGAEGRPMTPREKLGFGRGF
ncbi:conserved hypothetical protein [Salmonella enterica subsp. enterica serovar Virchow str. SL491]|uniref:Uncharacterized protein n=1 Tax=Salmonella virchow (strain SL491) TaxID=465517 RepID=A0A6C8F4K0_SALV4|nr:conserved hypothetical protein [Salmonella enterica subsp. enterica serovar Virchow str. SL491]